MSRVTTLPAPMTAARADGHPRTDDRGATDPDVRADRHGLGEFLPPAQFGVKRMRRRVNLDRRTKQRVVADADGTHVEDDAVEVEEDALAEKDVRAVVAEERRLHPDILAAGTEQRDQDPPPLILVAFARVRSGPDTDLERGSARRRVRDRRDRRAHRPASSLVQSASIPPQRFGHFRRRREAPPAPERDVTRRSR